MGYTAKCSGWITVNGSNRPDGELQDELNKFMRENLPFMIESFDVYKDSGDYVIDLSSDWNKYHEEELNGADGFFNKLAAFDVKEGQISFEGEDDSLWQFKFDNGRWKELSGHVVYTDRNEPDYDKLKQMFIDYVTNDLEKSGNPDYIDMALKEVGCTAEMQKVLGLDIPDPEINDVGDDACV